MYYLVDKAPPGEWEGGVGHLTEEVAKKQLPPPSDDHLILVCGPPPMMKAISGDKAADKSQGVIQLAIMQNITLPYSPDACLMVQRLNCMGSDASREIFGDGEGPFFPWPHGIELSSQQSAECFLEEGKEVFSF
jgi:NAD(P)H-flavin reductase